MKLRRRFSSSLRPLLVHKTRAFLALSGVAVGVAAVIVSRSLGAGAQQEMTRAVESMGTNLLLVKPLPVLRSVARPQVSGLATSLRPGDWEAVSRMPLVDEAAPCVDRLDRVKVGRIAMRTTVRGTTAAYLTLRRFEVAAGRFFDGDDERQGRRVAVLGAQVQTELGKDGPLVGKEIRIGGIPFDVIGILAAKGTTAEGADQDNQILIPLRTALRRVFNTTWLTTIYAGVADPDRMDTVETELQLLLRDRHRRGVDQRIDDFAVQNTTKTRAFQQEMIESLSRYAAGLAAIALVLGGIGILALMLLSVRERTGEIGLRMAVGALPRDVLIQFLIEAAVLAILGWIAGAATGGLAALALAFGTDWPMAVPTTAVVTSFAMAAIIGIAFGALPARNAARVPPIEALLMR
ncbi:multidrug ABC transporter substrate-binding protein [Opitutaceae bacterium EW11]|nr:multidrug ABC transporter substrate-binding protein [Opitutaceae bacterium EW11]